ncbi:MAG: hypothetical protein IJJ33_10135 [Victivallales bacterium]|nr:hypothetical protein [Victivallales bacterium]
MSQPSACRLEILSRHTANIFSRVFEKWGPPQFFIQLGSGFHAEKLFDSPPQRAPLAALPDMPAFANPDSEHPQLLYGTVLNHRVLALQGHRHLYEGLGVTPCILPLCGAFCAGVRNAILIESGLSLDPELKSGNWLLLTDFINGHHCSPLDGNQTFLSNPFPDMSEALSQHLNSELMNALAGNGIFPRLGIFHSVPGSQFPTVSEARLSRSGGADMLGHDLAMEIIMGHALGMNISAFALAAATAPNHYSPKLSRQDILDTRHFCSSQLFPGLRRGIADFLASFSP